MTAALTPAAAWTNDCQGKQDYDGEMISISCRFYPGAASGHGFMTAKVSDGGVTFGTAPYGKNPSAAASILLRHGDAEIGDYKTLRRKEFEAETEAEVKALVEAWVLVQFNEIAALLGEVP